MNLIDADELLAFIINEALSTQHIIDKIEEMEKYMTRDIHPLECLNMLQWRESE